MILEILLAAGAIVLLLAIIILLGKLCVQVGYLFGYEDKNEDDPGAAYFGILMLMVFGLGIWLLYLFGKWLRTNW